MREWTSRFIIEKDRSQHTTAEQYRTRPSSGLTVKNHCAFYIHFRSANGLVREYGINSLDLKLFVVLTFEMGVTGVPPFNTPVKVVDSH